MGERGQTQQDYLVGVSIFLLTTAGIFSFVPGIFNPFEDPVGEDERAMATRLADELLHEHSVVGTDQTLNHTALTETLTDFDASAVYNVEDTKVVNVTIHNSSGQILAGGHPYSSNSGPAASVVRVVRFRSNSSCEMSCRLVVRVW